MRYRTSFVVVALLWLPMIARGQEAVQHLPGNGVADPAGKVGYWPAQKGGLVAVDLGTGKVIWQSPAANRALLATADDVYAQTSVPNKANEIRVVSLSRQEGKKGLESDPIKLPDWVSVTAELGRSYAATGKLNEKELVVTWEAKAWYAGGANPPQEILDEARKQAQGNVWVNLKTGKAVSKLEPKLMLPKALAPQQSVKLNNVVYTIEDRRNRDPNEFLLRRFVKATDAAGKELWTHEIAGGPNALAVP